MTDIITSGVIRAVDANGAAIPGAKAYFYQSGTNTPVTVYANATATTPHATPVVADGSGVFPPIYTAGNAPLKMNVTTALGSAVPGYPLDPVALYSTNNSGASSVSFSPITGNGATNVQAAIANIQPVLNNISTFAKTYLGDTTAAATRTTLGFDAATIEAADANNATKSGFYRLQNTCANLPSVHAFECFVSSPNGTDIAQVAIRATDGQMWRRIRTGGAWGAWVRLVDASNVDALTNVPFINQNVVDVSASRAWDTTYQNTTSRPIFVIVEATSVQTYSWDFRLSPDGVAWQVTRVAASKSWPDGGFLSHFVPPGWYYKLQKNSGTVPGLVWREMK